MKVGKDFILNPNMQCYIVMVVHTFQLAKPNAIKLSTSYEKVRTIIGLVNIHRYIHTPFGYYNEALTFF